MTDTNDMFTAHADALADMGYIYQIKNELIAESTQIASSSVSSSNGLSTLSRRSLSKIITPFTRFWNQVSQKTSMEQFSYHVLVKDSDIGTICMSLLKVHGGMELHDERESSDGTTFPWIAFVGSKFGVSLIDLSITESVFPDLNALLMFVAETSLQKYLNQSCIQSLYKSQCQNGKSIDEFIQDISLSFQMNASIIQDADFWKLMTNLDRIWTLPSYLIVDLIVNPSLSNLYSLEELSQKLKLGSYVQNLIPMENCESEFLKFLEITAFKPHVQPDIKKDSKKFKESDRIGIMKELKHTEKSFAKKLHLLHQKFHIPLVQYGSEDVQPMVKRACPSVIEVLQLSESFIKEMSELPDDDILGFVLLFEKYLEPFLPLYKTYALNYYSATSILTNLLKQDPGFMRYLEELRTQVQERFEDLRSEIIQRITRYQIMFMNLYKATPLQHPDNEILYRLALKTRSFAAAIDEACANEEMMSFPFALDKKLNLNGSLAKSRYRFIQDFEVWEYRSTDSQPEVYETGLVILTDLLLLVRKSIARQRTNTIGSLRRNSLDVKKTRYHFHLSMDISKTFIMDNGKDSEFIIITKTDQKQSLYSFKAKNEFEKRKIIRIVQHQIVMKRISLQKGIWSAENICEGLDVYYRLISEEDKYELQTLGDVSNDVSILVYQEEKDIDSSLQKLNFSTTIGVLKMNSQGQFKYTLRSSIKNGLDKPYPIYHWLDLDVYKLWMQSSLKHLMDFANEPSFAFQSGSYREYADYYLKFVKSLQKNTPVLVKKQSENSIRSVRTGKGSFIGSFIEKARSVFDRSNSGKRWPSENPFQTSIENVDLDATPKKHTRIRTHGLPRADSGSFSKESKPKLFSKLRYQSTKTKSISVYELLPRLLVELEKRGSTIPGLYRLNCNEESLKAFMKNFSYGQESLFEEMKRVELNVLTKFLLKYLLSSEVQDSLWSFEAKRFIIEAAKEDSNDSELVPNLRAIFSHLSLQKRKSLHLLFSHFKRMAEKSLENGCTPNSIATIYQTLLTSESANTDASIAAIECMIFYADSLFGDFDDSLDSPCLGSVLNSNIDLQVMEQQQTHPLLQENSMENNNATEPTILETLAESKETIATSPKVSLDPPESLVVDETVNEIQEISLEQQETAKKVEKTLDQSKEDSEYHDTMEAFDSKLPGDLCINITNSSTTLQEEEEQSRDGFEDEFENLKLSNSLVESCTQVPCTDQVLDKEKEGEKSFLPMIIQSPTFTLESEAALALVELIEEL